MPKQTAKLQDRSHVVSTGAGGHANSHRRTSLSAPARRLGTAVAAGALLAVLGSAGILGWRETHLSTPARAPALREDPIETQLRRAVEKSPKDAAARIQLGQYYDGQARPFEAIGEYAEARHLAPADPEVPLRLATALRAGGAIDLAAAQLVEALQGRPGDLRVRRQLADLYLATGEPEQARAVMEEQRQAVWQDTGALLALGQVRQASGDDPGAMAAYRRALALDGKNDEALYRLGRLYLRQGRTDEARDAFFHALFYEPHRPEYPFYAGMAYLQQPGPKNLDRAYRFFGDALVLDPNDAPAHYEAGVALERMGRRSPALTQYSLATVADPNGVEPLPALSRGLAAVGRTSDAHRFLARCDDLKDRPAEAVREYQRMQAAAPDSVEPALLIGQVYLRTRQSEKAVAVTEAALKRHPNDPELLERVAVLNINGGDWPSARRLLQHWLSLDPKASRPRWLLGRCELGALKYKEAVEWLEQAVALEPRNAHYLGFLGAGLLKLGPRFRQARAVEVLAQAVALAPEEAEYRDLYAQALQGLGREEEARRQFLRALDADPSRISAYLAISQLSWRLHCPGSAALFPTIVRSVQHRASEENLLWTHVWQHPDDVAGRLKLARFFCHTARLARARDQLDQAPARQPASTEAQQLLVAIQRVQEAL